MSIPMVVTHAKGQTRLLTLQNAVIAGLIGNVLVNTVLQIFVVRGLIPPLTIIMVLTVVVAALCAVRWRWAPLLAALWCLVAFIPGWKPYTFHLTHPAETGTFIATVFGLGLYLVAIVAGVAATVAGERAAVEVGGAALATRLPDRSGGICAGESLVSETLPSNATAGVSSQTLAQLPTSLWCHGCGFSQRNYTPGWARRWPCGSTTATPRSTTSTSTS